MEKPGARKAGNRRGSFRGDVSGLAPLRDWSGSSGAGLRAPSWFHWPACLKAALRKPLSLGFSALRPHTTLVPLFLFPARISREEDNVTPPPKGIELPGSASLTQKRRLS